MSVKRGIDVSAFQDEISWGKVSGVDFVLIRAGYGRNNIDSRALQNIKGCIDNNIPFGLYWFSYALSTADAAKEADYVCDIADKYKITFPVIGYDWEYDSDDYAADQEVSMTNDKRYHFAKAFLKRVKQRGYTPLIYTNYDYLNKGFRSLLSEYDVWFSYPGGNGKPDVDGLTIWQYSWEGDVPGINADVDMNYCYKDYPTIIKNGGFNGWAKGSGGGSSEEGRKIYIDISMPYLAKTGYINTGEEVKTVQLLLNAMKYGDLTVDGFFGNATAEAVKKFQKSRKLDQDGIVGKDTWRYLLK